MPTLSSAPLLSPFTPGAWLLRRLPGLALCALLAWLATQLAALPWLHRQGISALTAALVLGLLLGNTVYPRIATHAGAGMQLAKQQLLRAGIVLYGLRLTLQDLSQIGWAGVLLDALVLASTFGWACWLGRRWLGLDVRTTLLIGAGSSICGAAAVLATAPVVRARSQDVAVAIATVVVFGTVGTFLYPALYHWPLLQQWLPMDSHHYGLYVGATVHEVAQVVAAGAAVDAQATQTAVIAKMVRVMMLAPFLLLLSLWLQRRSQHSSTSTADAAPAPGIRVPWFAVGFVAMAGVHSLGVLPAAWVQAGLVMDEVLLAMAMAALGLGTHWQAVRAAGARPLLLAALLMLWLVGAGLLLSHWLL